MQFHCQAEHFFLIWKLPSHAELAVCLLYGWHLWQSLHILILHQCSPFIWHKVSSMANSFILMYGSVFNWLPTLLNTRNYSPCHLYPWDCHPELWLPDCAFKSPPRILFFILVCDLSLVQSSSCLFIYIEYVLLLVRFPAIGLSLLKWDMDVLSLFGVTILRLHGNDLAALHNNIYWVGSIAQSYHVITSPSEKNWIWLICGQPARQWGSVWGL